MPFIKIEGLEGKVFVPEENTRPKKHQCPDCFSCQFCSDERCSLCLKNKCCSKKPQVKPDEKSNL